jgi:PAS domain S-box-containing protein
MDDLRKRAEKALQDYIIKPEEYSPEAAKKLIHELRVHQVELEMQNDELLTNQREREASRKKYADLYDFAPVGYCTLERDGTIREINLTAVDQLGVERSLLLKKRIQDYVVEDDQEIIFLHLRKAFETQTRQTCELRLLRQDGTSFYAQLESIGAQKGNKIPPTPPLGKGGTHSSQEGLAEALTTNHCRTTITDITRRKQTEQQLKSALKAKTALLQEVHHRTRNNMQVISSLLNFQSRNIEDEHVLQLFKEVQDRINSMALVHEKLHREDLTTVNLKECIEDFTKMLLASSQMHSGKISLRVDTEPVLVSIDFAVPFGLILNELLSNALKHAFPGERVGEIRISLHSMDEGNLELQVSDNGIGMPEDFDVRKPDTIGFQLVKLIAEHQLRGNVELKKRDNGTEVVIRFKKPPFEKRI